METTKEHTTGEKIFRGELVVLVTLDHQVVVATPEKAREIRDRQMLDILDNGFNTVIG